MVRRGGVEGHALPPPQALLRPGTPPISQLATWRHQGGSRLLWEKLLLGSPPFISGPSCLPLCSSPLTARSRREAAQGGGCAFL